MNRRGDASVMAIRVAAGVSIVRQQYNGRRGGESGEVNMEVFASGLFVLVFS